MEINTLVVGYVPPHGNTMLKGAAKRNSFYYKEIFSKFDLGKLHYITSNEWKMCIDDIDPLFVIVSDGSYVAKEIQKYKKDSVIYVIKTAGQVFRKKAESNDIKEKQIKILEEVSEHVRNVKEGGTKSYDDMRKFASLSYDDMYGLIKQAIISDDADLQQQAWRLLTAKNSHSNFIWMRVQMLIETWEWSDSKHKEEILCMAMKQHVENGSARQMEIFIDEDGQKYHQYMFLFFNGVDADYIRRIPIAVKGQTKSEYESLLHKYDTPNGPRMMLEAGTLKTDRDKYIQSELKKVERVLIDYKKDPTQTKKQLGVLPFHENDSVDDPLTKEDIERLVVLKARHRAILDKKYTA